MIDCVKKEGWGNNEGSVFLKVLYKHQESCRQESRVFIKQGEQLRLLAEQEILRVSQLSFLGVRCETL